MIGLHHNFQAQKDYLPRARMHVPEEIRQTLITQQAMAIRLRACFDHLVSLGCTELIRDENKINMGK